MNQPSRTEDDLEHPTWNQNPPFLAPDLTTRQDLNGIANSREHRHGCSGPGNGVGFPNDEKQAGDGRFRHCDCECDSLAPSPSAMSGLKGPLIASETVLGGEGQVCLPFRQFQPPSGWYGWTASVIVVSTSIHVAGSYLPALFGRAAGSAPDVAKATPRPLARRDSCAGSVAGGDDYNTPLHVGALLIILAVSSMACAVPMLAAKFPILRIPEPFFFAVRHLGTGVLLATAFVHLLPTAFISLGDPCLSNFWTTDYPAMPGAIALVGIFFVSIIEMIFSPARNSIPRTKPAGEASDSAGTSRAGTHAAHGSIGGGHCSNAAVVAAITRPSAARRASTESSPSPDTAAAVNPPNPKETLEIESQGWSLTAEQRHKKSILQCMLLEVGILFHSVFIGMALSVAVGNNFVVLLIAIAFHQTFEGLALGVRIASISWPKNTLQPWLMVIAYGCTTPIGQAIGLATHTLYSPDSEFGLILVGTMNAVSSGLLVFAALIELLAEDFLSDQSWSVLRGRKRVMACLFVFLGAICMSFVGAWA
ncbi:ZIP zinc transporter-domain-containing protein [Chaetomium fimeti]|uniref:ZIP zinc transporter-domain-containing protein n=1 Tax=Chaetomium fimeti TaxID=1854472 RepID=A0AAE0HGW7_9PEZI|nr:ZIP zinc transporter-domain-containing protein [Chaetomium fimeti]